MLTGLQDTHDDSIAKYHAAVYGRRGDTAHALDRLESAVHNRDPVSGYVKEPFDPCARSPASGQLTGST